MTRRCNLDLLNYSITSLLSFILLHDRQNYLGTELFMLWCAPIRPKSKELGTHGILRCEKLFSVDNVPITTTREASHFART